MIGENTILPIPLLALTKPDADAAFSSPSFGVMAPIIIPKEIATECIEKALEKAAGEKKVRAAIEGGMSATDAFKKFEIL